MASIKDDRGYNQGFKPTKALEVRTKRRSDYIVKEILKKGKGTILEIGCGTGKLSYYVAKETGLEVTGTDICAPFIEEASNTYKLKNLKFQLLDFNNINKKRNFKSHNFDYIIGNGILHHLYYNLDIVLPNLYNLLSDKGEIIFLEPNIYNPYCLFIFKTKMGRKLANLEPAEMAFTNKYITKKLNLAKFKNIKICYRDFLLPNTPDILIEMLIKLGNILEKIPFVNRLTQSIYITAKR